jgi:hypothetical protein
MPSALRLGEHAHRMHVGRADHGRRRGRVAQQRSQRAAAVGDAVGRLDHDRRRQLELRDARARAFEPLADAVVLLRRAGHDCEAAMAELDEQIHRATDRDAMVEADAWVSPAGIGVGADIGRARLREQPHQLGAMAVPDECDAVDAAFEQRARLAQLHVGIELRACHEQGMTELVEAALQRLDARGEDADTQRRHDRPDRAAAARRQRTRRAVAHVAQLAHRRFDPESQLGADLIGIIEDARDGGGRHAGASRDIGHGAEAARADRSTAHRFPLMARLRARARRSHRPRAVLSIRTMTR